jgi:hypothetical protein
MKIKELIKKLQEFDPDKTIACYCEDEGLKTTEGSIQLFEVSDVSETEAVSSRLDDGIGKPWLKFGKAEKSIKFVLIDITSDI